MIWMSLFGTRRQLITVIVGLGVMWVAPLLLLGAPDYPVRGFRAALLFVCLASMIGFTVQRLVAHERTHRAQLQARDTEREALLSQLDELARTDPLTGVLNRRAWDAQLEQALSGPERQVCVALVDLDRFKRLNDRDGHQAGNRALRSCVAGWSAVLRGGDTLARLGGDEFGVLLHDCGLADAQPIIDRLQAATAAGLACSIGVAQWDGREHADDLQRRADQQLYIAKRAGGDRSAH